MLGSAPVEPRLARQVGTEFLARLFTSPPGPRRKKGLMLPHMPSPTEQRSQGAIMSIQRKCVQTWELLESKGPDLDFFVPQTWEHTDTKSVTRNYRKP
jgi:hypothetical protein